MKTAFLLGAGASHPYQFPLGSGLHEAFKANLNNQDHVKHLNQLGFPEELISDLKDCLAHSRFPTVDQFLDAKKRFREIGGILIAQSILNSERKKNLFPARDWYLTLYEEFARIESDDLKDTVSFVTLNYDRSLEFFFKHVSRYEAREESEESIREVLESITVIHAHGSIGTLEELPFGEPTASNEDARLKEAGARVQIISDDLESALSYQNAKKELNSTDRIIIIGFGYHQQILDGLLSEVDCEKTELIGTSKGLPNWRKEELDAHFSNCLKLKDLEAQKFIEELELSKTLRLT